MLTFLLPFSPPSLVDNVRQALTAKDQAAWEQTRITGTADYYGEKHQYSFTFKPDGSFVQVFTGPVGETYGYDGKTFWRIDRSRGVCKLDFEDRDKLTALGLILTSSWLSPDLPASLSEDGSTITLTLKPSGQKEIIKIDPKTYLPSEATFPSSSGVLKIVPHDWKLVGDRKIPMSYEISEGGLTDSIHADQVDRPTDSASYVMPEWKPDDVLFQPDIPASIETKRAISGHLLVRPKVNGKDVGWFILDSGAEVMVIDQKVADDLKLGKVGKIALTGVGGTIQSSFRNVDEFILGPAIVQRILFTQIDLSQIGALLGIKLAGIVGGDFFRRTIVSIDLNKPSVEISPREGFALSGGDWLPLRFSTGNPAVEASVDGAPKSWYRFDTGADGTLTFHAPFVKRYKLLDGRKTTAAGSGGVGGTIVTRSGQVKWFELAGHRFVSPTVVFSTGTTGAFSEPYLAGNIGQEFMKPFKIVLDFTGSRIALLSK